VLLVLRATCDTCDFRGSTKTTALAIPPSHQHISPQCTMAYITELVKAGKLESDDIVIA
jgi:hypothetical protein